MYNAGGVAHPASLITQTPPLLHSLSLSLCLSLSLSSGISPRESRPFTTGETFAASPSCFASKRCLICIILGWAPPSSLLPGEGQNPIQPPPVFLRSRHTHTHTHTTSPFFSLLIVSSIQSSNSCFNQASPDTAGQASGRCVCVCVCDPLTNINPSPPRGGGDGETEGEGCQWVQSVVVTY